MEGESLRKEKELKAKEKFIELKAEHEKVILSRDKKMAEAEKRIRDKESQVSNELSKNKKTNQRLEDKIKDYDFRLEFLDKKKLELEKAQNVLKNADTLDQIAQSKADIEATNTSFHYSLFTGGGGVAILTIATIINVTLTCINRRNLNNYRRNLVT